MNKRELTEKLAARSGESVSKAGVIVGHLLDIIESELADGQDIGLLGFGRFYRRDQAVRLVRNPKTGEPVMFQPRVTIRFKPGKYLLTRVNQSQKEE